MMDSSQEGLECLVKRESAAKNSARMSQRRVARAVAELKRRYYAEYKEILEELRTKSGQ